MIQKLTNFIIQQLISSILLFMSCFITVTFIYHKIFETLRIFDRFIIHESMVSINNKLVEN
jgi:hypothetical protein